MVINYVLISNRIKHQHLFKKFGSLAADIFDKLAAASSQVFLCSS